MDLSEEVLRHEPRNRGKGNTKLVLGNNNSGVAVSVGIRSGTRTRKFSRDPRPIGRDQVLHRSSRGRTLRKEAKRSSATIAVKHQPRSGTGAHTQHRCRSRGLLVHVRQLNQQKEKGKFSGSSHARSIKKFAPAAAAASEEPQVIMHQRKKEKYMWRPDGSLVQTSKN